MESGLLGVVSQGSLSMLLLEGIKRLVRLFKPEFVFSGSFYLVMLPVLNVAVIPLLALLGFSGYVLPENWLLFSQGIVQVLIASLISVGGYNTVAKPFMDKFSSKG